MTKCKDCKNCKTNWFDRLFFGYQMAICNVYPQTETNKASTLIGQEKIQYRTCSIVRRFDEKDDNCSRFERK